MSQNNDTFVLRIYLGENKRHQHMALHEWIVRRAREEDLAGATVLRGVIGYGATSRADTSGLLRLSADAPVVVELVDRRERLTEFLRQIEEVVDQGMATLTPTEICLYRSS